MDKGIRVVPGQPSTLPGAFGQPVPLPNIMGSQPPAGARPAPASRPEAKKTVKVPHPAKPAGLAHHRKKVQQGKAAVRIRPSAERKKGR